MKPITIHQVRAAVGGKALLPLPATAPEISAVCTDTRQMEPGSLFVALKGEHFDAHRFLPQVAAGGAVAALVEEPPAESLPNVILLQVASTRVALGKLARLVREQMKATVIAVAGSNGKTSTKHLIASAIGEGLSGSISPKSYNNDIGVPLTIFPADPLADYLVLEMGTNHPGEIKTLTDMARPDVAVITNCSAEHLEGLGDLAGVRRENASIIEGMNPRGLLIVNGDDPQVLAAVANYPGKKITFGFSPTNDLFATEVECREDGVRFRLNNRPRRLFVPMLGRHTASNALAAIAVARRLGVVEEEIFQNLETARGPEMRLQLQKVGDLLILNDAYNANPASMRAALETASLLPTAGRRVAVVGDMRELGPASDGYHQEVGRFIASSCRFDEVAFVGDRAALMAESARSGGYPCEKTHYYADSTEAAARFPAFLRGGDLVLLKASRSIKLESVAKSIIESRLAAHDERLLAG
jgi:UDP-N-acetylmuramoyl-tripeptide--D-alanyl-D-alanine ligase